MEDKKLLATLKRREKTIENLRSQLSDCRSDLKILEGRMKEFQEQIEKAKTAMMSFLGLENIQEDFIDRVENTFAMVRTKSHWM